MGYNERLDYVLASHGAEEGEFTESLKQAITSLIKELVADAKPKTTPFDNNLDGGYATDIRNSAIDQFEQNLLKALEEV